MYEGTLEEIIAIQDERAARWLVWWTNFLKSTEDDRPYVLAGTVIQLTESDMRRIWIAMYDMPPKPEVHP